MTVKWKLKILRVLKNSRTCIKQAGKCISEGRKLLERPRQRWEDNIKQDRQEEGWAHGLDCCSSEQGEMTGYCECGNEHSGPTKMGGIS